MTVFNFGMDCAMVSHHVQFVAKLSELLSGRAVLSGCGKRKHMMVLWGETPVQWGSEDKVLQKQKPLRHFYT